MINFSSFRMLFQRYSALHRSIPLLPRKIRSPNGKLLGRIEVEKISGNMHYLRGWTFAERIIIAAPDREILTIRPSVPRGDVRAQYGGALQSGFELQIPLSFERRTIAFIDDGHINTRPLRTPWKLLHVIETIRLTICLMLAGLRGLPAIVTYLRSSDAQTRAAAKKKLKQLLFVGGNITRRDRLFSPRDLGIDTAKSGDYSSKIECRYSEVSIILPVYNAFDLLSECLARVAKHTDLNWHLFLIEDCSTDPRIRPYLREWASTRPLGQVSLLENETNLGFIGSVNRGFAQGLERGAPLVLLNSDAFVPDGWASRLLAPFSNPSVASATPMSNDAEILNAPIICQRTSLAPGQGDRIDGFARTLLAGAPLVNLPTGVGFCMAISPAWLARLPQFDPIFGRGYGEEVDWCRSIMGMGGHHVGVPNLFVEHRGGESFGTKNKRDLIEANGRIVTQRHPNFDREVQEFIASDPFIGPRITLGLAAISGVRVDVPIYLCHSLGGGAEDAMMHQIRTDLMQDLPSVVLRVGGRFRYELELHTAQGISYGSTDEDIALEHLWRALPKINLIYICGVGDLDPPSLPDRMVGWTSSSQAQMTIEIHDFYPLSPSYTLLDSNGKFTGPPLPNTHTDPIHSCRDCRGQVVGLAEWQMRWQRAMKHANRIIVFSENSRDMVTAIWPDLDSKITLRPHPLLYEIIRICRAPQVPARTIGVLGNIGLQKGAKVLKHLSGQLSKNNNESLVVIGNVDPAYPLSQPALVHGNYTREDIGMLAENYSIDCWLIPSVWPETFSFTTREALATGLPVWCFDLGAQAEALRKAGQSDHILTLPNDASETREILKRILNRADCNGSL